MKTQLPFCRLSTNSKFVRILILMVVLSGQPFISKAQFFDELSNPQITVNLQHPPGLGIKVKKIAFGPSAGDCADQIINSIITDFSNYDLEIIDRANLQTILSEHNFSLSGFVDQQSAAQFGKILGPSALVFVKVMRCHTDRRQATADEKRHNYETNTDYYVKAYYSYTKVTFKVSVQAVDLTTTRIFSAQIIDDAPEYYIKSYEGFPDYPSEFEVQDEGFKNITQRVHQMFLPWNEKRAVYFFDDKKGGLKEAFQALARGDINQALEISKTNLETCKNSADIKEKILAHAYYNLGTCYWLSNDFDNALVNLREAERIRPGKITDNTIKACLTGKQLAENMQKIDDKANFQAQQTEMEANKKADAENKATLKNADIIDLTQKKLPNSIISSKIKTSKCTFNTSPDALVELTSAGVSEEIINLMIEKASEK